MARTVSAITGFILLFVCYHAAEYMIMFRNSALGFLGFQLLFFLSAAFIGKRQYGTGLSAWGMGFKQFNFRNLAYGLLTGITIYGVTFLISLSLGLEHIDEPPVFKYIVFTLPLFIFGNFFSSFSEDILTRGYLYKHLGAKLSSLWLVVSSALLFVANHIYKWHDGFTSWSYLFVLGCLLMLALVFTKNLWMTGGIHWAGNVFFYFSHTSMTVSSPEHAFSPNYILAMVILAFIPLGVYLIKKGIEKGKIAVQAT